MPMEMVSMHLLTVMTTMLLLTRATEIPNDGIDQDCDGLTLSMWWRWFEASLDCDDNDPTTYPGATKFGDGIDQDCNGSDAVQGSMPMAMEPIQPSTVMMLMHQLSRATEIVGDGIDQDCDGLGAFLMARTYLYTEVGQSSQVLPLVNCTGRYLVQQHWQTVPIASLPSPSTSYSTLQNSVIDTTVRIVSVMLQPTPMTMATLKTMMGLGM